MRARPLPSPERELAPVGLRPRWRRVRNMTPDLPDQLGHILQTANRQSALPKKRTCTGSRWFRVRPINGKQEPPLSHRIPRRLEAPSLLPRFDDDYGL